MKVSLKALRVNANLNQQQVAERLGIAKVTLVNWEANKTYPTLVQLSKLCELYSCTLDDIFLPDKLTKG